MPKPNPHSRWNDKSIEASRISDDDGNSIYTIQTLAHSKFDQTTNRLTLPKAVREKLGISKQTTHITFLYDHETGDIGLVPSIVHTEIIREEVASGSLSDI